MTKLKQSIYRGGVAATVLAIASMPLSASAMTSNSVINATVRSTISISSVSPVSVVLTPGALPVVSSASDTVTVSTNNSTGYVLTLANADTNRSLVSGTNTIAAHTGTPTVPSALANNTWGYAIAGAPFNTTYAAESSNSASTSLWAGVPASTAPVILKTTSGVASGDQTTVWYGVRVNSTQPTGVYTDTVTYSATARP